MRLKYLIYGLGVLFCTGCREIPADYASAGCLPAIFPDYAGVTIPVNIAPLNFYLTDSCEKAFVRFFIGESEKYSCWSGGEFVFSERKWKALLAEAVKADGCIRVEVFGKYAGEWKKFDSFSWQVKDVPIDGYVAYRLIEPGYERWSEMGLYQRNLTNFEEKAILENRMTHNNCMNCHTFDRGNPGRFVFHMRGKSGGTMLIADGKVKRLNTRTSRTLTTFTYPAWHPSGKYIAFSTNITHQFFHGQKEKQIEVYDRDSDIVLYDIEKNEVVTDAGVITTKRYFETYPTWSPDGKSLYFSRADSAATYTDFKALKYNICRVEFDMQRRQFGTKVDTVFATDGSCVFPRVSPDGNFLLFTLADYGCFPIWHKEADLCMLDLGSRRLVPCEANSEDTESFHSWSSDGRWVVFSSRRQDGLFTRLYFSYVDENGCMAKPFLLPQRTFEKELPLLKSYNVPVFVKEEIKISPYDMAKGAEGEFIQVE